MASEKSNHIYSIDVLRFISAIMVALAHLTFSIWRSTETDAYKIANGISGLDSLGDTFWFGWIGVEIFFVISGFVILNSVQKQSAGRFLWHRLMRLIPGLFICSSIVFMIKLLDGGDYYKLSGLFLRSIFLFPKPGWLMGSLWTLVIESWFYFFIFIYMILYGKNVLNFIITIGLASGVFWAAVMIYGIPQQTTSSRILLLDHGCFFALGGLLLVLKESASPKNILLTATMFFICLVEIYSQSQFVMAIDGVGNSWEAGLIWAVLIFIVFCVPHGNSIHIRPNIKTLVFIMGISTYPIYLLNENVGSYLIRFLPRFGVTALPSQIISLVIIIFMSCIVTLKLEMPLRNYLNKRGPYFRSRNTIAP